MKTNVATIVKPKNPKPFLWKSIYEMKVRTKSAVYTIEVTTSERTRESSERFAKAYLKSNFKDVVLVDNTTYRKRS